jgi:hypothetical protein
MNNIEINHERLNFLRSLELSQSNITKRMYRAKKRGDEEEYYCLCLVRGERELTK